MKIKKFEYLQYLIKGKNMLISDNFYKDQIFKKLYPQQQKQLKNIEFFNCTFKGLLIQEFDFLNCSFEKCNFENCDLSLSSFNGSTLMDVVFADSKLAGINWTQVNKPIFVNFLDCVLNYSSFVGVQLTKSKIINCSAKDVDFENADLRYSKFDDTDLSESRFLNTNLSFSNFSNALNYNINPSANIFKKTKFSLPEAVSLLSSLDIILE